MYIAEISIDKEKVYNIDIMWRLVEESQKIKTVMYDYYLNFDSDAYTHLMARDREKEDVVKAMGVIKPEYLQKMLTNLPPDLLQVVTTQIDTEKFAHSLIFKFPELLAQLVAQ